MQYSEIRHSTIDGLLKKVREQKYGQYLLKASIQKIRGFTDQPITFDFPVTALIGPNGGGKSSVLGAAGCAYKVIKPGSFFPKSSVGDESMSGWRVEYELIDKEQSAKQVIKRTSSFKNAKWVRADVLDREVLVFGIERTVPTGEKTRFRHLKSSGYKLKNPLVTLADEVARQVEHILGKSVAEYRLTQFGYDETFLIGKAGKNSFSEFHFGAGESSIIRMISKIESAPANSLILIEEIENGLHPVATKRMVEYLIDVAERKSIQTIFTTHSDYALEPLPGEGIWASISGELQQGKLSVQNLRAVTGKVEKKLAIFVEDTFAKEWVNAILRVYLTSEYDHIEVHAVSGDGNAVATHKSHMKNPTMRFRSMCIIDGDSKQVEDEPNSIYRLPGEMPETAVYESVLNSLDQTIAILTVMCQLSPNAQDTVARVVRNVFLTTRDHHVLFSKVGIDIGWVAEHIVRGAFLSLWVQQHPDASKRIAGFVSSLLDAQNAEGLRTSESGKLPVLLPPLPPLTPPSL